MNLLPYVGEGRARTWIGVRHSAITDRSKQHGNHGDQYSGRDVPMRLFTDHAIRRHGGGWLDDYDSIQNQVQQGQCAAQFRSAANQGTFVVDHAWPNFNLESLILDVPT